MTTISPTVAVPSTTAEIAAQLLAYMSGQTGVVTDSNPGSQIRTLAESWGNVVEIQSISAMALALQAMIAGCWAAFGVIPLVAIQSQGIVTFSTGLSSPPPATQNVTIFSGTVVQTTNGIQFSTTETVTLLQGTTSINATAQAIIAGSNGNVSSGTILSLVSGLVYPIYVNNAANFVGGTDAESIGQTMSRFTALVQSLGLSSPVAIANACIGVQVPLSSETVLYATLYEPWITQSVGMQQAGWTVFIDNGAGTASTALIQAVTTKLDGAFSAISPTSAVSGFRDAGVPYSVMAVTPVNYSVVVTGVLYNSTLDSSQEAAVQVAVQAYQTSLQFGSTIQQAQLTAAVGAVLEGIASAYTVTLFNSSDTPATVISVPSYQRAFLTSVTVTLS